MNLSVREQVSFALILYKRNQLKRRRPRKCWVHPLNLLRPTLREHLKVELMYNKYPATFFQYTRMNPDQLDKLLFLTNKCIVKYDTNFRHAISPRHRLFVTLRYLSTGDSIRSIATSFSMGRSTAEKIIWDTTNVIWDQLYPIYLKCPTESEWETIIRDFDSLWNFPNSLGAIDRKHVMIQAPSNSGFLNYNYKGFFSIVLFATFDANYKFTSVDIGAFGRQSDGGIFSNSIHGKKFQNGSLKIPRDKRLGNSNVVQPCTFVGDNAFSLSTFMLRPYPGKYAVGSRKRIFNYRLSVARCVIENAFGVLCSRFRIYKRAIIADEKNINRIIKATVVLHNFLKSENDHLPIERQLYCPPRYVDENDNENGGWHLGGENLPRMSIIRVNNYSNSAKEMRDRMADYFVTLGSVPWQNERAVILSE